MEQTAMLALGLQKIAGKKTPWREAFMNTSWIHPAIQPVHHRGLGHPSILLDLLWSGLTPARLCSLTPSSTTRLPDVLEEVLVNR
ncbi:uncharacterized protein LACBIDRAFT_298808 [Laccaria bicolor S238N-H82]|uniref:Predicted protein n=1 Tax=Laccaria bicolor (strain S238N-H82 / ATCC MYA-4686) TaxID=486041 RepID=B0E3H3_LACBS|nr:uncharacterized protein LACBIDRAFT_298808 [Laccaria bicolor S238N-H82]EDQ98607.1 predicted protein [Laccaria bicolor S238N-H82]|eukprot:XP_001890742.1 predicted protein [Laccaria bicolor S238N-H82]